MDNGYNEYVELNSDFVRYNKTVTGLGYGTIVDQVYVTFAFTNFHIHSIGRIAFFDAYVFNDNNPFTSNQVIFKLKKNYAPHYPIQFVSMTAPRYGNTSICDGYIDGDGNFMIILQGDQSTSQKGEIAIRTFYYMRDAAV